MAEMSNQTSLNCMLRCLKIASVPKKTESSPHDEESCLLCQSKEPSPSMLGRDFQEIGAGTECMHRAKLPQQL